MDSPNCGRHYLGPPIPASGVGPGRLELLTNGLKVTGSWVLPRASGPQSIARALGLKAAVKL